jgi:hypothetical protein
MVLREIRDNLEIAQTDILEAWGARGPIENPPTAARLLDAIVGIREALAYLERFEDEGTEPSQGGAPEPEQTAHVEEIREMASALAAGGRAAP